MHEERSNDNYWRDLEIKLLGWGVATCFIVIGWTINSGELFYFCSEENPVVIRTIFFNLVVLFVGIAWIKALQYINSQVPEGQSHISKRLVVLVARWFLGLTFLIVFASSIVNPKETNFATLNNKTTQDSGAIAPTPEK